MRRSAKETAKQKEQPGSSNVSAEISSRQRSVKFQVRATQGSEVFLAGSFNNWDPNSIALKRNGGGLYSASVNLAPGRHEYKFLVDGAWRNDEQCSQQVANCHGSLNSVIELA